MPTPVDDRAFEMYRYTMGEKVKIARDPVIGGARGEVVNIFSGVNGRQLTITVHIDDGDFVGKHVNKRAPDIEPVDEKARLRFAMSLLQTAVRIVSETDDESPERLEAVGNAGRAFEYLRDEVEDD